jgi:hypothetical protein
MMKRCIKFVKAPPEKGSSTTVASCHELTDDGNARRPLSFHAVSFGEESSSPSLRRMAKIALEVQNDGAKRLLHSTAANVPSSYTKALDTVSRPKTLSFVGDLLLIIIRSAWRRRSSGLLSR